MPTEAKNIEIPISLIIKLALTVVYVTKWYLAPKLLNNIATIRAPPANPSFIGCGIPGNLKGILPNNTPNAIPIKIAIRLGSFNCLSELPRNFSILMIADS